MLYPVFGCEIGLVEETSTLGKAIFGHNVSGKAFEGIAYVQWLSGFLIELHSVTQFIDRRLNHTFQSIDLLFRKKWKNRRPSFAM